MAGSEVVANPVPAGEIRQPLSGDGTHFIFGSDQKFEPPGNPDNGNVTIYDRDLEEGTTQVVSTMPDGSTIEAGNEVAELGVSKDGDRVVIGVLTATDSAGHEIGTRTCICEMPTNL